MNNLDNLDEIKKLDSANSLESIKELKEQCLDAWTESTKLNFSSVTPVDLITISGMGGSLYSYYFVTSIFAGKLKIPIIPTNSYHLPSFLLKNSLVLASTYSGTTEETLSCANEALLRGLKLTGITTGGKLKELLTENNLVSFIFNPAHNPSNQPRMGQGYMIFGTFGILNGLGAIELSTQEVEESVKILDQGESLYGASVKTEDNPAKTLALKLRDKAPIIVASEFLDGNAHAWRNQFNESGKQFSDYHIIPELNHHLMEGLSFPEKIKQSLSFLFVNSNLYEDKIQKRIELTKEIVNKQNIDVIEINPIGQTKLEQSLSLLQFGSYVTFYLAVLNNVDPNKIPWVDFFKEKLSH